jgi:branched-chain amino acid transport system ATP-binding protein
MSNPVLMAIDVTAGYGDTIVLDDLSLNLGVGESISVIGRNGVGKTTLLATIMGHTTLHGGQILLADDDQSDTPSFKRVKAGLGYVPQEREIFPSLTVDENMNIGAKPGEWTTEKLFELFPNLAERRGNMGNQLSGGELQMLAIARALMTNPKVLLMDEPSEGLAPVIVEELFRVMTQLRDGGGMSIILVEQNTRIALDFSKRTMVMDRGRIIFDGESEVLKREPSKLEELIGLSG